MIIGNGSIAKMLNDRKDVLFFASGISDSKMDDTGYWIGQKYREHSLLTDHIKYAFDMGYMLVYFSTISKFSKEIPYVKHKNNMERVVKSLCDNYTIINLGNIWECTNPNTFINAYKANPYEPRDEWKYMISKEQLLFITDNLPTTGKHEISIFGEMKKAIDCI